MLSNILIVLLSFVQVGSVVAIFEAITKSRSRKYRAWVYLIAGIAPLAKLPLTDFDGNSWIVILNMLAAVAGVGLCVGSIGLFIPDSPELPEPPTEPAKPQTTEERAINL